jgi:signal transduction histidine kinase
MLNKLILIFLFFIIFVGCNSSEEEMYTNNKLDYYFDSAYDSNIPKEKRINQLDSAIGIIEETSLNDSILFKNYFKVANRYFSLLEYEKYKTISKKILKLSVDKRDSLTIAKAEYYLGDYYFFTSKNDSAYYYYISAEKKYKVLNDKINLANTLLHKALVLLYEKDYLGSEAQTIRVLDIAKELNDETLIYECYVNLGSSILGLKNYNVALDYYEKALFQIEEIKDKNYKQLLSAQMFNNIGFVYLNLEQYENALINFEKGLKIEKIKEIHPIIFASLLDRKSYSMFKKNPNKGFEGFKLALKISDSINDIAGKIKSRIHLTEYYLSQKDTFKALELNNEANKLSKEAKYNDEVLTTLDLFTKIDPSNGLKYAEEYIKISDSLQEQERNTRNKLARIEYETDEIIQEKELLSNQKSLVVIVSAILLFISALLYIILYQRSKQKELVFAQEQQTANEEIYRLMINQQLKADEIRNSEKNRIAKDLHDGIMNKLTSTRLNLFVLSKKRDEETIKNCIGYINDIQNIEKEVRLIAHELNNDIFEQKNSFKSILKELFQNQNKLFLAKCEFHLDENILWDKIDASVKMNLYRIVQEALNNCNKYANASKIDLKIYKSKEDNIILSIKDNGVGFNPNKIKYGIGIKNMSDRAKLIGGSFIIESKINKGTTIFIEFAVT